MFDCHTHTKFSVDSRMQAADALKAAKKKSLGLIFTEHLDFETNFFFDAKEYWRTYEPLRADGKFLRLGLELGLIPNHYEDAKKFIAQVPFDFVIGSIHFIDGQDIYSKMTYRGKMQNEIYTRYFDLMEQCLYEYGDQIDVLGHIDYIVRYAPYEDAGLHYAKYKTHLEKVLHALLETDTLLEMNTRLFSQKQHYKELVPIFKRYAELGGKFVTVGSDAHYPDAIGSNFYLAEELAHACDLKIISFCQRKKLLG